MWKSNIAAEISSELYNYYDSVPILSVYIRFSRLGVPLFTHMVYILWFFEDKVIWENVSFKLIKIWF